METEIKESTEETVVKENEEKVVEDSTEEVKTPEVETSKDAKDNGNFIPRARLNEVIQQKNDLKTKLEEMTAKLNDESVANEDKIKAFQSQIEEIKNSTEAEMKNVKEKYEETLFKNSGVEDVEYLKFLAAQKTAEGLDLESAINSIKEEKPNMFISNRKTVGSKPSNNNTGKISKSEFATITDRAERMRMIREGLVLND